MPFADLFIEIISEAIDERGSEHLYTTQSGRVVVASSNNGVETITLLSANCVGDRVLGRWDPVQIQRSTALCMAV
jgi:hypothetical protein